MSIKVVSMETNYGQEIRFAFIKKNQEGHQSIMVGDEFKELPELGDGSHLYTFKTPRGCGPEVLQQLANIIYKLGYKPEKMRALTEELDRVVAHKDDAIAVRDRILTMMENDA